jgi:hypothetical protein
MPPTGQKIEIPLSKGKLTLMLIGSVGFIASGLWFIIKPPIISNPIFGNPTLIFVIGVASIFFFGLSAFYITFKLPDKKPGLIIDQKGIMDNSSGLASGQILWTDIERISVVEVYRQKLIMLEVKNPKEYIDRQKSVFKRKGMEWNLKMYGSPISLTSNGLKISFENLLQSITDNFDRNRQ